MLDATNEKIIKMIESDAKQTNEQIAKVLGLSEGAVRKRIKKLEEEKVIIGYKARIKHSLIGKTTIIIGFDIAPEYFNSAIEAIKSKEEALEVYSTTGDHTAIAVAVTDSEKARQFVSSLEKIKGVRHVYPAFVQETIK